MSYLLRAFCLNLLNATLICGIAVSIPKRAEAADAWINAPKPDAAVWQQIAQSARNFVSQETPPGTLTFAAADKTTGLQTKHVVLIHYFPPFPLSFTDLPVNQDIYSVSFLRRDGEGGKYQKAGGFVRDRPLPGGPWNSPYWVQINDAIEILRARQMGVDGFAFDMLDLHNGRWGAALGIMLDTAAQVAPEFRIVPEPGMATLKDASAADLEATLAQIWDHPSTYHLPDGRMLITPFGADIKPLEFWQQVISDMANQNKPIALMPVLLDVGRYAKSFAAISYGISAWGSRDITAPDLHLQLEAQRDISAENIWMMPVAPQDARPNQAVFWEAENTTLYRTLWTQAIQNGSQYVQLITWNDYSEGTPIEPSAGTQFVFYDLGAFYTAWFKEGHMPAITKEAIYYTHRREMFNPTRLPRADDTPFKPQGTVPVENDVEMVAFLQTPATLQIDIGTAHYQQQAGAGLAAFRVPAQPGTPVFRILHNGIPAIELKSQWPIVEQEGKLDPNYVGGSSNRPFVAVP